MQLKSDCYQNRKLKKCNRIFFSLPAFDWFGLCQTAMPSHDLWYWLCNVLGPREPSRGNEESKDARDVIEVEHPFPPNTICCRRPPHLLLLLSLCLQEHQHPLVQVINLRLYINTSLLISIPPALLRDNWHMTLFKAYSVLIGYIHQLPHYYHYRIS